VSRERWTNAALNGPYDPFLAWCPLCAIPQRKRELPMIPNLALEEGKTRAVRRVE
jgi:hypothetical protein